MNKIFIFTFFISIIEIILNEEQNKIYKCGVDHYRMSPPIPGKELPINYSSPLYRRRLQEIDSDGFKKFNIYLDFENLKEEIKIKNLTDYQETIIECLKKVTNTLMSLLRVKPLKINYNFFDSDLRFFNINYWEKEKFGDDARNKNISLLSMEIDLVIFSRFENLGNLEEGGTLATAGPIFIVNETHQPIAGRVNINPEINFSKKGIKEYLNSLLIHELTHVLGFSDSYFNYFNFNFSKIDKYGIKRFYLKSPQLIKVAKKYFNCSNIEGIELENDGSEGTIGSHWESRLLLGEYMCGYLRTEEEVISEFTLAYLEDTGYYKPNYYTGGLMRYGKNKGCAFIEDRCVNDDYNINPEFENEFFDSINDEIGFDPSCSSGRLGRTYNYFSSYSDIPTYYQYFENTTYGGYRPADYCPISRNYWWETQLNYYSGSCSKLGDGTYGSLICYKNETWKEGNVTHIRTRCYNNSFFERITGEQYSESSFCFLSSLIKKAENKSKVYSRKTRSVCFESFCSSRSLTVKIHENYIVCPRAGGKIKLEEYEGYLLCPDYNLICTGTTICNNIFDCVDKKSEIKNNTYNYDYKIKTSQNIENADIATADNETNYELSEDGQCPLNCKQCLENKKCIKCREDYEFVGTKNEEKTICIQKDELKTGYYIKDSIYYKCMDSCENCINDTSCNKCLTNYTYVYNSCIPKIQNCEEYSINKKCQKCSENFSLNAEKGDECIRKEDLNDSYYTKDNGNSYYFCNGEGENHIPNCSICSYNSKNDIKLECNECQIGFVILDNETIRCYAKEKINEKEYYYINQTHMKKCSNNINHCDECESADNCTKCEKDFYLLNNEGKRCYNIDEITPINEYYLDENNITYYSCNDTKFNLIENCKECNKKNSCSLCKDKYTFIDGDKSKCYEISGMGENYIIDPEDISNYIKCSDIYNNCSSCNSSICLKCNEGYIFINDNFKECLLNSSIDLSYYYTNDGETYYSCKNEKYKSNSKCSELIPSALSTDIIIPATSDSNTIEMNPETTNINIIETTLDISNTYIVEKTQDISDSNTIEFTPDITNKNTIETTQEISDSNIIKTTQDISDSNTIETTHDISNTYIVETTKDISDSNTIETTKDISNTIETTKDISDTNTIKTIPNSSDINKKETTQDIPDSNTIIITQDLSNTNQIETISNSSDTNTIKTTQDISDTNQIETNQDISDTNKIETIPDISDSNTIDTTQHISDSNTIDTIQHISDTNTIETTQEISDSNTIKTTQDISYTNKIETIPNSSDTNKIETTPDISDTNKIETTPDISYTNSIENSIFKSQIINTIMTTSINASEPNNQTVEIESPFNIITIILLQIKLQDSQLYLYLLIDSYVSNTFSLKIKINIYTRKSLRNLQEIKKEMEINITPLNNISSNTFGGLYTFVPDQTFKEYLTSEGENARIEVINITPNIYNSKYKYNVEMGNNPDYLDTAKIEQLLQNNQAVDLSQIKKVNIYHIQSISQGCSFELTTNETIEVSDRKLNLEFQEIKSHKNKSIICSLKQNTNIIKCDLEEITENNYTFNNYIDFNYNELFSIISNKENSFPMNCFFRYNKNNTKSNSLSKGIIALIIIIPIIAIIIICSLILLFHNKSNLNENNIKESQTPTIRNLFPDSAIDNLE